MGNNNSGPRPGERSLHDFMANQNFRNNQQGVYSHTSSIPAYPGADDDHAEAYAKKDVPMTSQHAVAIKNDFILDKNSVSLVPTNSPGQYYLTFKFSSMTDVEITIFYHGKDNIDEHQTTESIYVDTDSYTPIKSYVFGQVKNQEFPAHASILDSRLYKKDDLLKFSNGTYPLIIKMETKTDRINAEKKILYTYFTFRYTSGKYEGRFLKQKLQVHNNTYILDDIYGIADSDLSEKTDVEGKECTICFTNKVDTVVLPCKHMCLCSDCAKDLRDRESQKCPMCRTTIESYMGLKKF